MLNGIIYLKRSQDDFDSDHIIPTADNDDMTSLDEVTITNNGELTPTVFNIDALADNSNLSKLVKVEKVKVTKPSRFFLITTTAGEDIQLVDQMNVGGYDLNDYVDKTVDVAGVFTWNMMRWAIFPISIAESQSTGVEDIMATDIIDADVYTITGINLGKVDINSLPAGMYIKAGKKYMTR